MSVLGAKVLRHSAPAYIMPMFFGTLSAAGLVYLTRHFIYENPQDIRYRTRESTIRLARKTKVALLIGYGMCIPMFGLACLGLSDPEKMNRTISAISPYRFLLTSGDERLMVVFSLLGVTVLTAILGAFYSRRIMLVGLSTTVIVIVMSIPLLQ